MSYGIRNIQNAAKGEDIVKCILCDYYYYEDITDERNDNSLKIFKDESGFFRGCPLCETDEGLGNVEFT